jgi:hypothetical protein
MFLKENSVEKFLKKTLHNFFEKTLHKMFSNKFSTKNL